MPIPALSEGNFVDQLNTYSKINALGLENIVQGHGDIILRGEIDEAMRENINYMNKLKEVGEKARIKRNPGEYLTTIHVEDCGKSRVHLGGLAETLHKRNLIWIYKQVIAQYGMPTEEEYEPEPEDDDFDNLAYLDPNDLSAQNFQDDINDYDGDDEWDDGYPDDDDDDDYDK